MASLWSAQGKLARARKHIADLEPILKAFNAGNPYGIAATRDSMRKPVYTVTKVTPTGPDAATTAGDALQNLRSALDHLAFTVVTLGRGAQPIDPRNVAFPIVDDRTKYLGLRNSRLQGARQNALDAVDKIEPWRGGKGEILWRLSELNNIDKHRLLITVGSFNSGVDIGRFLSRQISTSWAGAFPEQPRPDPQISLVLNPADRLCPLKIGDVLFTGAPDEELGTETFYLDIALVEPGVLECEPIVKTLQGMADAVDKVLTDFAPLV
jgi:hypothetical protein